MKKRLQLLGCLLLFGAGAAEEAQAQRGGACANKFTGLIPLTDLQQSLYEGFEGGLYPGAANILPTPHLRAGLNTVSLIVPRAPDGSVDPLNGAIGFASIGMSNTRQEFEAFMELASQDTSLRPSLVFINGAEGGVVASEWADPNHFAWQRFAASLADQGLSPSQLQVVWVKLAQPASGATSFVQFASQVRDHMKSALQVLKSNYPNVQVAYFSSRIYGGYATTNLNPEPFAYENGFSVKWAIEDQISGDPELVFEGPGTQAPWMVWGPYLWADGLGSDGKVGGIPGRSDGLEWMCSDFAEDGTHPSLEGRAKVAQMLLDWLKTDPTSSPWFLNFVAEAGSVSIDQSWMTINLNNLYLDPVVIAGPPSFNGSQPTLVRIQEGSVQIRLQEWDYLDGWHVPEEVSYLVVEEGHFLLESGAIVEAKKVDMANTGMGSFQFIPFENPFAAQPIVLASVMSFNDTQAVTTRIRNVTTDGFELVMQEEEANDQSHFTETLSYVAFTPGAGSGSDLSWVAGNLRLDHEFSPLFVQDRSLELKLEEEQSADGETAHIEETVGFVSVSSGPDSFLLADLQTTRGTDPVSLRWREQVSPPELPMYVSQVQVDHNWLEVSLPVAFSQPVVVARPASYAGVQPTTVRIRNIESDSFEIRLQEWSYLDGYHLTEQVSFMVMEAGQYTLTDGTTVEASWVETSNTGPDAFVTVPFDASFTTIPAVFTSLNSYVGTQPVTTRLRHVTTSDFQLAMWEEEANDQFHLTERIGYIAMELGSGLLKGAPFEVATFTANSVFTGIGFASPFVTPPCLIADMQTTNGTDPATLRYRNRTAGGVEILISEEQSLDFETSHIEETVAYLAFQCVPPAP